MDLTGTPDASSAEPEALFRDQRAGLLRLAFLLSGSTDLAEDAVSAAFVGLVAHRDSVRDPAAYLRRAVVNRVKDTQRRTYRTPRRSTAATAVTEIPEIDETWHEIQRLSTRQRQIVVLRFYEDLPLVEIAELLGVPAGTVRSDLHRALATLKRRLT